MRVCFKVRDFPDPIVKEFDSLVYNQITNEARFYNYGNQGKDGSLYVTFEAIDRKNLNLSMWDENCPSLNYYILKEAVLENGFIDLSNKIILLKRRDVINTIVNDAKIDSRSINMRFVEEH